MGKAKVPTAHIEAQLGEIAKTVIMPGDPLRAKFIAENFLEDVKQFNGVRGMLGYTGTYKEKEVSVMGSGMGIPSIGIYSYELFEFYGVENIIRVGSCGGITPKVKLRDVIIGLGASTDSNYLAQYNLPGTFTPTASYHLVEKHVEAAKALGIDVHVGNIVTSDIFYHDDHPGAYERWAKMGILAIEMEAAGLYANAARLGKNAMTILTVSDMILTGEVTTSAERQSTFTDMMEITLEAVLLI